MGELADKYLEERARYERASQEWEGQTPEDDLQTMQDNLQYTGEFERGVKRGTHGLIGTLHGMRALASDWMGDTEARDKALKDFEYRNRLASLQPKKVPKFFSTSEKEGAFGSVQNLADWIAGTAGDILPSVAEAVASGFIGAGIGSMVVPGPDPTDVAAVPAGFLAGIMKKGAIKEAIKSLANTEMRRGVAKKAAYEYAERIIKDQASDAAKAAFAQAVKGQAKGLGAKAAILGLTGTQEAGGMYGDLAQRGIYAPTTSAVLGAISGLSEITLGNVPGMTSLLTKGVVREGLKKGGIKAALKALAGSIIEEAGQEGFQEFVATLNEEINDPKFKITDEESFMRVMESMAAGALGGLMFGGASSVSSFMGEAPKDLTGKANAGYEIVTNDAANAARVELQRRHNMTMADAWQVLNEQAPEEAQELFKHHARLQKEGKSGLVANIEQRILQRAFELGAQPAQEATPMGAQRALPTPEDYLPAPAEIPDRLAAQQAEREANISLADAWQILQQETPEEAMRLAEAYQRDPERVGRRMVELASVYAQQPGYSLPTAQTQLEGQPPRTALPPSARAMPSPALLEEQQPPQDLPPREVLEPRPEPQMEMKWSREARRRALPTVQPQEALTPDEYAIQQYGPAEERGRERREREANVREIDALEEAFNEEPENVAAMSDPAFQQANADLITQYERGLRENKPGLVLDSISKLEEAVAKREGKQQRAAEVSQRKAIRETSDQELARLDTELMQARELLARNPNNETARNDMEVIQKRIAEVKGDITQEQETRRTALAPKPKGPPAKKKLKKRKIPRAERKPPKGKKKRTAIPRAEVEVAPAEEAKPERKAARTDLLAMAEAEVGVKPAPAKTAIPKVEAKVEPKAEPKVEEKPAPKKVAKAKAKAEEKNWVRARNAQVESVPLMKRLGYSVSNVAKLEKMGIRVDGATGKVEIVEADLDPAFYDMNETLALTKKLLETDELLINKPQHNAFRKFMNQIHFEATERQEAEAKSEAATKAEEKTKAKPVEEQFKEVSREGEASVEKVAPPKETKPPKETPQTYDPKRDTYTDSIDDLPSSFWPLMGRRDIVIRRETTTRQGNKIMKEERNKVVVEMEEGEGDVLYIRLDGPFIGFSTTEVEIPGEIDAAWVEEQVNKALAPHIKPDDYIVEDAKADEIWMTIPANLKESEKERMDKLFDEVWRQKREQELEAERAYAEADKSQFEDAPNANDLEEALTEKYRTSVHQSSVLDEAMESYWFERSQQVYDYGGETVAADAMAKKLEQMTPEEAEATLLKWRMQAIHDRKTGTNSQHAVLSLFDRTGNWPEPFRVAGYIVHAIDRETNGVDLTEIDRDFLINNGLEDIAFVLAACPCYSFTGTVAYDWARKDASGETASAVNMVNHTLASIEWLKPDIWAIENAVGRIQDITNIPVDPILQFTPSNYGESYTKRTQVYGNFDPNLPTANVDPHEGSKIQSKLGGKDPVTKFQRSITPLGFAWAFYMANRDFIAKRYARIEQIIKEEGLWYDHLKRTGAPEAQIAEAEAEYKAAHREKVKRDKKLAEQEKKAEAAQKKKLAALEKKRAAEAKKKTKAPKVGEGAGAVKWKKGKQYASEGIWETTVNGYTYQASYDTMPGGIKYWRWRRKGGKWSTSITVGTKGQAAQVIYDDARKRGEKVKPLKDAATVKEIKSTAKDMGFEAKLDKELKIVESIEDVPADIQDEATRKAIEENLVEGIAVVEDGVVYIIADHVSKSRIEQVLTHELVTHLGLRQTFGEAKVNELLDSMVEDNTIRKEAERVGEERDIDTSTLEGLREATEEWVAEFSETADLNPNLWVRVVAKVREWLRSAGLVKTWSHNDVRVLLSKAAATVKADPALKGMPKNAAGMMSNPKYVNDLEIENYATVKESLEEADPDFAEITTNNIRYSKRTFDKADQDGYYKDLLERVVERGYDRAKADKFLQDIRSVSNLFIGQHLEMLDYEAVGAEVYEAIKKNSDDQYKWSEDYTTICRKTLKLAATVSEIMKSSKKGLTADQMFQVRDMLHDENEVVNCAMCYVFSRWAQIGSALDQMANRKTFIKAELAREASRVKKAIKKEAKEIVERAEKDLQSAQEAIDTRVAEGKEPFKKQLAALQKAQANLDKLLNNEELVSKQAKKTVPKSLTAKEAGQLWDETFGDVPSDLIYDLNRRHELTTKYPKAAQWLKNRGAGLGKAVETRTEYRPGLLKERFKPIDVKVQNLFSGMRMQSWSDFDPLHVIDMMQVAVERAEIGLAAHAYTKMPDFVRLMAPTGVLVNMSLIPKGNGFNPDGSLAFDPVEGMPFDQAVALREQYETAGTIAIGISEEHIRALMADPRIDYIIPYHASGLPKSLQKKYGEWTDYEKTQGDKEVSETKVKARLDRIMKTIPSKARAAHIMSWEWWDKNADAATNSQNFLTYAKENGFKPRFEEFADDPNYFKLLIDRKMYTNDGKYLEQGPTTLDFDMDTIADIFNRYLDAPLEETTEQLATPNQKVVDEFIDNGFKRNPKKDQQTLAEVMDEAKAMGFDKASLTSSVTAETGKKKVRLSTKPKEANSFYTGENFLIQAEYERKPVLWSRSNKWKTVLDTMRELNKLREGGQDKAVATFMRLFASQLKKIPVEWEYFRQAKPQTIAAVSPGGKFFVYEGLASRMPAGEALYTMVHEVVHTLMGDVKAMYNPEVARMQAKWAEPLTKMRQAAQEALGDRAKEFSYAFTSNQEFVAEAWADPAFQAALNEIPAIGFKKQTVWAVIKKYVAEMLAKLAGAKKRTLFVELVETTSKMMQDVNSELDAELRQMELFGDQFEKRQVLHRQDETAGFENEEGEWEPVGKEATKKDIRLSTAKKPLTPKQEARETQRQREKEYGPDVAGTIPPKNTKRLEHEYDSPAAMYQKFAGETDWKQAAKNWMKTFGQKIGRGISNALQTIGNRLLKISPVLYKSAANLMANINTKVAADLRTAGAYIEKMQGMDKADRQVYNGARMNAGPNLEKDPFVAEANDIIARMNKKYKMEAEYEAYRKMMDQFVDRFWEVGIEVYKRANYFPRIVKDHIGLLNHLRKTDQWDQISDKIKEVNRGRDMPLSEKEEAEIANQMLQGVIPGLIGTGVKANKQRVIQVVTPEMMQFYEHPDKALLQYVRSNGALIEWRKFLGKANPEVKRAMQKLKNARVRVQDWYERMVASAAMRENLAVSQAMRDIADKRFKTAKENLEKWRAERTKLLTELDILGSSPSEARLGMANSIGAQVLKLAEANKLTAEQTVEVKNLLEALWDDTGITAPVLQVYRNITLAGALGQVSSAITQIQDLAWSFYENGIGNTFRALKQAIRKKSLITKDDIVPDMMPELGKTDDSVTSFALNWILRATGMEYMDTVGKETLMNASYAKTQELLKQAKAGDKQAEAQIKERLGELFNEDFYEVQAQLLTGDPKNEVVQKYAHFMLQEYQPISRLETAAPATGNWRLAYILKTYQIKQVNNYVTKVRRALIKAHETGDKVEVKRLMKEMTMMLFWLSVMGAGADALKDLLYGRKIKPKELSVDVLSQLVGISRWDVYNARREGLTGAMLKRLVPQAKLVDYAYKDLTETKDTPLRTPGVIPVVGKFYYWYAGPGKEVKD